MLDYLVKNAIDNIWCAPTQDAQFNLKLPRISKGFGAISSIDILWDRVALPTKQDRYHVFQLGHIDPDILGLTDLKVGWTPLADIVNTTPIFCNIYYLDGITIPKTLAYIYYDVTRTLVLAIREDSNFIRLKTEDPQFRVYSNTYFQSTYADETDTTETYGLRVTSTEELVALQNIYLDRLTRKGSCIAYHNGRWVSDFNPVLVKIGDYVEFDYDSSIKRVMSYKLLDLRTFTSLRDGIEKYLLPYPKMGTEEDTYIDFRDDVDIYITNEDSPIRYGVYYHTTKEDAIRMVTHKDYSVPYAYVESYILDNPDLFPDLSKVNITVMVRNSGLRRKLVYENNRIHELYKLDATSIKNAMLGIDSTVSVWRAEELENSEYVKVMGYKNILLTGALVQNAYGYNAISKLLGDTPKYVNNVTGNPTVNLDPAQINPSTVYEYNSDGLLLDIHNTSGLSIYNCHDITASLVEVIIGEGGNERDINHDVTSMAIDSKLNYRVYVCDRLLSGPVFNWVDITDTSLVTVVNGIMNVDVDTTTKFVSIVSDAKFLTYRMALEPVGSIYRFSVNELEDRKNGNGKVNYVSTIPAGNIKVWLNGHTLIRGIDYDGTWPEFFIYNKEYLVDGDVQDVVVRCTDFCNSDMTMNEERQYGFVENGFLSKNWKFDINDDRVQSIVVDGRLRHIDTVDFAENNTGISVSSSRNGAPYSIVETFVPFRGGLLNNGYSLRTISKAIDKEVSDYMTIKYPQPDIPELSPITKQYETYSTFVTRLLHACQYGSIDNDVLKGHYADSDIDELVEPFLYALEYDPAFNGLDENYVVVHPFPSRYVQNMDIYHYNFLQRVIKLYLNSKVNLSKAVNITVEGREE